MMQLRELRLTGRGVPDARMVFKPGGNVISGDSDTGKSYMLRCIDYILGAEAMTKVITEAEPYERVLVELQNDAGQFLTLTRSLDGGNIAFHQTPISLMQGDGTPVQWKRTGQSKLPDVTSIVLPFAGITEAQLRRNSRGQKQRLTLRTLLPIFLIDEISVIAERSPVLGSVGFDETARKRMLSYLLTGKDDEAIIADESKEIASAKATAKIALIDELLRPLDLRLNEFGASGEEEKSIERVNSAIEEISTAMEKDRAERIQLQLERRDVVDNLQRAEGQLLAIGELLGRYGLLDVRYESDLNRLDFIAEGAHFFNGLQEVRCPLCDQAMGDDHRHWLGEQDTATPVYQAAQAEAAKIIGHRTDLVQAIESLHGRRSEREQDRAAAQLRIDQIDARVEQELAPALSETKAALDTMIQRRLQLENVRSDREQAEALRSMRLDLENTGTSSGSGTKNWAALGPSSLRALCDEIEGVLKEWSWKGEGRVVFNEKAFDIEVDGQPRQSHGKGVRAILYAAFVVGLLKYCRKNNKPHPGFVMIDSPLTTYKKGQPREASIDPGVEAAFWQSLAVLTPDFQIVVLDNKEPPANVVSTIKYERFAGPEAKAGERAGFIPHAGQGKS
jgi:hypothetical protein